MTPPMHADIAAIARGPDIIAKIDRDIAWWDRKARGMNDSSYVLALAMVIGATKALRDLRDHLLSEDNGNG